SDGSSWWQLQWRLLVPQIRPIIELLTVIQVITVLSWVFNYVYVLTTGGPGYASSVMELYIWRSFSNGSNGAAAAGAVMLFGMAGVLIGGLLLGRREAAPGLGGRAGGGTIARLSRPPFSSPTPPPPRSPGRGLSSRSPSRPSTRCTSSCRQRSGRTTRTS